MGASHRDWLSVICLRHKTACGYPQVLVPIHETHPNGTNPHEEGPFSQIIARFFV